MFDKAESKSDRKFVAVWTPVTEKMPPIDEDGYSPKVLACFDIYPGVEICEYRPRDDEIGDPEGWFVGDTDSHPADVGINVVAWMPLPERWYPNGACTWQGKEVER